MIACILGAVPLAVGFSLWGFYIERSDREWSIAYVLVSIVIVIFVALVIATFSAICVGMPIYALTSRMNRLRPAIIIASAMAVSVVVHETWHGGYLFEDLESTGQFAFFGLYSGIAYWVGADVWRPIK